MIKIQIISTGSLDLAQHFFNFFFFFRSYDIMGKVYVTETDKSIISWDCLMMSCMAFMQPLIGNFFFLNDRTKKWWLNVYLFDIKCHFLCFIKYEFIC